MGATIIAVTMVGPVITQAVEVAEVSAINTEIMVHADSVIVADSAMVTVHPPTIIPPIINPPTLAAVESVTHTETLVNADMKTVADSPTKLVIVNKDWQF